jgi:hypothetical protein
VADETVEGVRNAEDGDGGGLGTPTTTTPLVEVAKRAGATPRKALAQKKGAGGHERRKDSEEARKLKRGSAGIAQAMPAAVVGTSREAPSETARARRRWGTQ